MMDARLQSVLKEIAEEAAPAEQIDLWKGVRSRLETSEPKKTIGEISMKPFFARKTVRLALTALVVLIALAILFVTPPGQTLARSLFHFFDPVETLSPVITPGETPVGRTFAPFYTQCGDYGNPTCTLQEFQDMVNFQIKGLATLPDGMAFTGVTGGPLWANLLYQGDQSALMVDERPVDAENQSSEIGTSATVETVIIHLKADPKASLSGEYVKGAWAGSWFSNADVQTLRWQDGDVLYTLTFSGPISFHDRPVDRNGLMELAESMTTDAAVLQVTPDLSRQWPTPAPTSEASTNFEYPLFDVTMAESFAGYKVMTPSSLPGGLTFQNASYLRSNKSVCLYYHLDFNTWNDMVIYQNPAGELPAVPDWVRQSNDAAVAIGYQPWPDLNSVTQVSINGAEGGQGTLVDGWLSYTVLCGSRETEHFTENTLFWKRTDGRSFFISTANEPGNMLVSQMEMVRLAEELNEAASSIPANALDPERLASLEIAQTQWGESFLTPTKTFGRTLSFAQVISDGDSKTLNIYYTGPVVVSAQTHPTDTLDSLFDAQPEAYRKTTVRGQPALYKQGCKWVGQEGYDWECAWTPHELTWFENGMKYVIMSNPKLGALSQDMLIQMAESLK